MTGSRSSLKCKLLPRVGMQGVSAAFLYMRLRSWFGSLSLPTQLHSSVTSPLGGLSPADFGAVAGFTVLRPGCQPYGRALSTWWPFFRVAVVSGSCFSALWAGFSALWPFFVFLFSALWPVYRRCDRGFGAVAGVFGAVTGVFGTVAWVFALWLGFLALWPGSSALWPGFIGAVAVGLGDRFASVGSLDPKIVRE